MKFKIVDDETLYNEIIKTFKCLKTPKRGACWILPDGRFLSAYTHNEVDSFIEDQFDYDIMQNKNGFLGDKINCIRVNDGAIFGGLADVYIQLPNKLPNNNQLYALGEWIDHLTNPSINISADENWTTYNLREVDSDYIIKRIKRYYASGRLYEQNEVKN